MAVLRHVSEVEITVCWRLSFCEAGRALISPSICNKLLNQIDISFVGRQTSSKRLTCRITWRLCDFQIRRRCYFFISSSDYPNIHQLEKCLRMLTYIIQLFISTLAFLDNNETEDQQHDPSHSCEETNKDTLDDSLVQMARVLASNTKQLASKC